MQKPIMEWNTQKKNWQVSTENQLFELWEPFLDPWPTSGLMQDGKVFELQTPERHTSVSASSSLPTPTTMDKLPARSAEDLEKYKKHGISNLRKAVIHSLPEQELQLLRSPTASQGEGGALGEEEARKRGNTIGIRDQAMDLAKLNGEKVTRLMPTPNTMDSLPVRHGESYEKALRRGRGVGSEREMTGNLREAVIHNLPTPTTRDYKDGAEPHERDGIIQTDTVARTVFNSGEIVLPTPTTNGNDRKGPNYQSAGILQELEIANGILPKEYKDWNHAKEKVKWAEPIEGQTKTKLDSETNWGKFEPAIRRWEEVLGRPAPSPTKPDGKDGAHRLSSAFTEWMMGVPEGWITDCGLKRNEELKACGNGVVPQQAELALRILLEGFTIPTGGGASESTNAYSKRHVHGQPKKLATKARVDALSNTSPSGQDGN